MRRLFGGILMAIGILVAGLSGLCSLVVLGASLGGPNGQLVDGLGMALLFGGIPMVGGLAVFFAGRAVLRMDDDNSDAMPPPPSAPDPDARPAHPLDQVEE